MLYREHNYKCTYYIENTIEEHYYIKISLYNQQKTKDMGGYFMKTKVFAVFLVFIFILSNISVTGADKQEDEGIEIITPVAIMEREPYYENQNITLVFSIKNKGENPIYIDSIAAAVVNEEEQYSNSQWFRFIIINPDKSYHFKGDITFNEPGKYSIFICYKKHDGRWVKFDDPSSVLELKINDENEYKSREAKVLPKAYKGTPYGPVNIFLNGEYKKNKLTEKELPEGLELLKDGNILGIPTKSGEFTFEIGFENGLKEMYKISVEEDTDALFNEIVTKKDKVIFPNAQSMEFSDIKNHWAENTIMRMYSLGIIKGFPNGTFCPNEPVTRAELSTIIFNAFNFSQKGKNEDIFTDIKKHWANKFISEVSEHFIFIDDENFKPDIPANREETTVVIASAAGLDNSYTNPSIVDCVFEDFELISVSSKELIAQCYLKGIVRGYKDNEFKPTSKVTRAEVCTIIENILINGVTTDILSSKPFDNQDYLIEDHLEEVVAQEPVNDDYLAIATRGDSVSGIDKRRLREMRLQYIFGKNSDGTYNTYKTKEEAEVNMVEIDIKVWDFDSYTGEKITKTLKLTVNKKIADETLEIFNSIYEHQEKFPIKSVVGYTWRAPYGANNRISEHNYGTAIDINWAENPQVINGVAVTQGKWQPGVNAYSIPADGSVVQIFKYYQWAWGGDAWGSHNRDYMHFSFLGN